MSLKMYFINMIIGPINSLPTVLSFFESCIENGSIDIKELYDDKSKLCISIPEK